MGSPISGTLAEIYLKLIEELHIKHWIENQEIVYYKRYVDDILIIFDQHRTNETTITSFMDNINEQLDFKATREINKSINYLDLTINRSINKIEININRKPTNADITIQHTSNHPRDHKLAAFTYYINRMITLPITEKVKKHEWKNILTIAQKNGFPKNIIHAIKKKETAKQKNKQITPEEKQEKHTQNKKWTIFTYHSPLIRKVTNLFKNTDIHIAFKSNNTIYQQLAQKANNTIYQQLAQKANNTIYQQLAQKANNTIYQQLTQKAENRNPSGIYEIKRNTCSKNYVGQSGRPITIRHKEHIKYIKTNNPASAYATHILNNRHEYGTANDTLKLIYPCRKSKKMNHWENMYIQIYHQQNLLITEQQVNEPNPSYELAQLPHAIRNSSRPDIT